MQELTLSITTGDGSAKYTMACPTRKQACPDLLPEPPCPQSCFGDNGVCKATPAGGYQCECEPAWTGDNCGTYQCEGAECLRADTETGTQLTELYGQCANGQCVCGEGYTGVDCRLPEPQCDADCTELVRFPLSHLCTL